MIQGKLNSIFILFNLLIFNNSTKIYDEKKLEQLRDEVKSMFYHAYDSYIKNAYPYDELRPLSCDGVDTWGSYSLTLIDTLDTLVILGNYSEFRRVAQLIIDNTQFDLNINVSVFETNIRIIGGLLSAHLLSYKGGMNVGKGWPCNGPLLHLAEKIARKLIPAFDTKTGMPFGTVNLRYGVPAKETPITCTAGVGTYLLEFGTLSRLTGDPLYEKIALRALHALYSRKSRLDLFGNHIDTETGKWTAVDSGIGAGVDSFFEYLVKGGILFQKPELMNMFKVSFKAIQKHLSKNGWHVWATMGQGHVSAATFQSLEAYWPGLLSLIGELPSAMNSITNYHRIWKQYGAMPEIYNILQGKATHLREGYPLRPEFVESAMYLYRATKDPYLLEIGEDVLYSIKTMMKTDCGYATVRDVTTLTLEDRMESFFLAETVKYLYLLFDPKNFIHNDGDEYTVINSAVGECTVYGGGYIFNTEAHPIDPSALHCCSGISEKQLEDIIGTFNELKTFPKFYGRSNEMRKSKKFKAANESIPSKSVKGKVPLSVLEETSPQLLSTSTSSIQLDSINLETIFQNFKIQEEMKTKNSEENEEETSLVSKSLNCEQENEIVKFQRIVFTILPDEVCPVIARQVSIDDKSSILEKLLDQIMKQFNIGGSKVPLKTSDNSKLNGIQTMNTKKSLKQNTESVEKLKEKFEQYNDPASQITKKTSNRNMKKKGRVMGPSGINPPKIPMSITSNPSTNDEIKVLDSILGPENSRSISVPFSIKWLHKIPELVIHLIPSERFDLQNFYSRMSKQFTNEAFVREYNLSVDWLNDYNALKCDIPSFRNRFLFLKSWIN